MKMNKFIFFAPLIAPLIAISAFVYTVTHSGTTTALLSSMIAAAMHIAFISGQGWHAQKTVARILELELAGTYKCPHCGMVSHHPMDIEKKYCGHCHKFA